MNLLDVCLFVVVALHLIESCRHLWRMQVALRWLKASDEPNIAREAINTLHLLIPVYQEAGVIKASVEYFARFANSKVHVYYISTEKEGQEGATCKALEELARYYPFERLHFPGKQGVKADQLNWAIEQIVERESCHHDRQTYFGIYDVDSRPEAEAIEAVLRGAEAIYQQPAIYLENYRRIGFFQQVGALLQTKWELCRNVPVLYENSHRHLQKHRLRSLPCCTGHGFFIRSDIFQQWGPFDTKTLTEDLELGYRLAFHQVPITLLKAVDFTGYAPTPRATVLQASRWFSGEFHLLQYYLKGPKSFWLTLLILKRYYLTFKWAFGAPLVLLAMLVLALTYPISIVLILISFFVYMYLPFKLLYAVPCWRRYLGDTKNLRVLLLLGTPRALFHSLGPLHYLLHALFRQPLTFVRTPKN